MTVQAETTTYRGRAPSRSPRANDGFDVEMRLSYTSYTLGVLEPLRASEPGPRVRSISCSSAGMIAGLAYACAELDSFGSTLFEMLSGDRFINLRRFWRVVDVDYLVDDVVMPHLAIDSLADSIAPRIWVSLTGAGSGELTRVPATPENARELLRATMAIPVLYGRPVQFPALGAKFVDGGIAEPIPLFQALKCAQTDDVAVVLANKPLRLSGDPRLRPPNVCVCQWIRGSAVA